MSITYDMEAIYALIRDFLSFQGSRVLDVGCGDGEYTLTYAAETKQTTGIDPDGDRIETARSNTPPALNEIVRFFESPIEAYVHPPSEELFDIVLFGWSL